MKEKTGKGREKKGLTTLWTLNKNRRAQLRGLIDRTDVAAQGLGTILGLLPRNRRCDVRRVVDELDPLDVHLRRGVHRHVPAPAPPVAPRVEDDLAGVLRRLELDR
jgi:hypothetical protein